MSLPVVLADEVPCLAVVRCLGDSFVVGKFVVAQDLSLLRRGRGHELCEAFDADLDHLAGPRFSALGLWAGSGRCRAGSCPCSGSFRVLPWS